jgi:hypothetical protein
MSGHYREDHFPITREVSRERVENYDVIYRHDHAIMNAFEFWMPYEDDAISDTYKLKEKLVPMVFATPRREYAENDFNEDDDTRYTAMEWEGDFYPTQLERIVNPSVAVTRLDISFDQVRYHYAAWRKLVYSDDLNVALEANFPLPYNFSYQFDFWTLQQAHLNIFMEQWARKFPRPTHWVDVQYPPPWGTQTVHTQGSPPFANTSTFEGGEEQRQLRGVATVNVFGWIPLPASWKRTIQKFSFDMIEEQSQEILAVYETELANKQLYWETGDKEQVLQWK